MATAINDRVKKDRREFLDGIVSAYRDRDSVIIIGDTEFLSRGGESTSYVFTASQGENRFKGSKPYHVEHTTKDKNDELAEYVGVCLLHFLVLARELDPSIKGTIQGRSLILSREI